MKIIHWLLKQIHYLSMGIGMVSMIIFICATVLSDLHDMGVSAGVASCCFFIAGATVKYL